MSGIKVTISDQSSIRQYKRKKHIITELKILNVYSNNTVKPIINDLRNNTVIERLELHDIHDFIPLNSTLRNLHIESERFYGYDTIWHITNLTSLHMNVKYIVDYDPFTNKLNTMTNLRTLYMDVSIVLDYKPINMPNLVSLSLLGRDVGFDLFIKLAKCNYKTLIVSMNMTSFMCNVRNNRMDLFESARGFGERLKSYTNMYNLSTTLRCLKFVSIDSYTFSENCRSLLSMLDKCINIVDFDISNRTDFEDRENIDIWLDAKRAKNKEYQHKQIVDIYLIFAKKIPAYCMLWILDWIPVFDILSHVYKIKLLQSIYNFANKHVDI
jgi:hypothetical protein